MRIVTLLFLVLFSLSACNNAIKPIIPEIYIDSVLANNQTDLAQNINEADIKFWEERISSHTPDYTNKSKYAASLVTRFHLLGNIKDLQISDSILRSLFKEFNGKEVGPIVSLVSQALLQHRFKEADSLLTVAKLIGIKRYESEANSFDVNFELGNIILAKANLRNLKKDKDFGYQFRKSKMMHYNGELDSSLVAMQKAAENAGQMAALKYSAISNLGDLYMHAGRMEEAYNCFETCIKANPSDLHSLMGIGWIALVYDHHAKLAERIFKFAASKNASPELLLKMMAVAEYKNDTATQFKFAKQFESIVTNIAYGNMYHKYLIQLYTGVLQSPAKAETIALKELDNRATPQTYAWYAWALLCNGKKEKAYEVYQQKVSGKLLESVELYWMGKLMQTLQKRYNANQYFEEAKKNIYDLSPSYAKDLNLQLSSN